MHARISTCTAHLIRPCKHIHSSACDCIAALIAVSSPSIPCVRAMALPYQYAFFLDSAVLSLLQPALCLHHPSPASSHLDQRLPAHTTCCNRTCTHRLRRRQYSHRVCLHLLHRALLGSAPAHASVLWNNRRWCACSLTSTDHHRYDITDLPPQVASRPQAYVQHTISALSRPIMHSSRAYKALLQLPYTTLRTLNDHHHVLRKQQDLQGSNRKQVRKSTRTSS